MSDRPTRCRDEKCWHDTHASPVVTRNDDGSLTLDWPDDMPDHCIISKPLLIEMYEQINTARLSDITTPICPDCQGAEWMLEPCPEDPEGAHCGACTDGHIPPKVWVGMLTDALRDIAFSRCENFTSGDCFRYGRVVKSPEGGAESACQTCIARRVLRLADSVTPKENE